MVKKAKYKIQKCCPVYLRMKFDILFISHWNTGWSANLAKHHCYCRTKDGGYFIGKCILFSLENSEVNKYQLLLSVQKAII